VDLLEDEIQGYKNVDIKESRELIATIKYELHSLHNIIDEYLQFTRLPKIKLETGDVNKSLQETLAFLEEELRINKIALKSFFEQGLPPVKLDYEQFRRAFLNIIRNAIQAMKEGGALEVATRTQQGSVEITVTDSGVGISEENLEQIFTPFFSTKAGGTGLGLSITRRIITEHKGDIICESRVGEGTRFIITIPLIESDCRA
jgi:two-component system NtrC family sensor kinase